MTTTRDAIGQSQDPPPHGLVQTCSLGTTLHIYVADTSIGKWDVGFQLKGLLVACMCTLGWTVILLSNHNEQHFDSFNTKQTPSVHKLRISF